MEYFSIIRSILIFMAVLYIFYFDRVSNKALIMKATNLSFLISFIFLTTIGIISQFTQDSKTGNINAIDAGILLGSSFLIIYILYYYDVFKAKK